MIIKNLFLNKPECIINLPESLLTPDLIKKYRSMKGLAIVEMAGRDSVAAAVKAVKDKGFTDLLPVYTYTGTEYGKWSGVEEAVRRLSQKTESKVHDLLITGSPDFWHALNGRLISTLIKRFGIFIPCVGCHLYLHSARIPLSVMLGIKPVISGERESHDGEEKLNQTSEALDSYIKTADRFKVPLLMPLRYISAGKEIENILGFKWEEGMEQLECTLSGNYRNTDGSCDIKAKQMKGFEDLVDSLKSENMLIAITGDHSTPSRSSLIHSGEPVPLTITGPNVRIDRVSQFDEIQASQGCLGFLKGKELMMMLLNYSDRSILKGHQLGSVKRPYYPIKYPPFKIKAGKQSAKRIAQSVKA